MPWKRALAFDPICALLSSGQEALVFWTQRQLLGEETGSIEDLWELAEAQALLRKQRTDGSWRYPGRVEPYNNYALLETFRSLRHLVVQFGLDRRHPAIAAAAEFVFSCQTAEGDLRGILGNQYMPYYHGAILELLIRAGYADDRRVMHGLDWLLTMRQDDGGWIVPTQAVPAGEKTRAYWQSAPVAPDRSLPFSHLATGMVLRGLVAHPRVGQRSEVRTAVRAFKRRLLTADRYNDRRSVSYWTKFQYPSWWTDLINGLDILAQLGYDDTDPDAARALAWFLSNQDSDGLWTTGYGSGSRAEEHRLWVGYAICHVLTRFLK